MGEAKLESLEPALPKKLIIHQLKGKPQKQNQKADKRRKETKRDRKAKLVNRKPRRELSFSVGKSCKTTDVVAQLDQGDRTHTPPCTLSLSAHSQKLSAGKNLLCPTFF